MILLPLSRPVTTLIPKRYSCRTYLPQELEDWLHQKFTPYLNRPLLGLWGNPMRFLLVFNAQAKKQRVHLGTYGFIHGAVEYLVGVLPRTTTLVEFGHLFEQFILYATDIGLGTCWLGGSFSRTAFSRAAALGPDEYIPAVAPIGYIKTEPTIREQLIRRIAKSDQRKPWAELFFTADLQPLTPEHAGPFGQALEMVRLAPSASNRQPWRIVKDQSGFHFYLKPAESHRRAGAINLQEIDLGIALCHFELTASEAQLPGTWRREPPQLQTPYDWRYIASWITDPAK